MLEKDFKAEIVDGRINAIGIDRFDNSLVAQPLYKIFQKDWQVWLDKIIEFCDKNDVKCYAENAFNEVSDCCVIKPLDVKDSLCNEIDNQDELLSEF